MPSPVFVRRYYAAKYAESQRKHAESQRSGGVRFSSDTYTAASLADAGATMPVAVCEPCSLPEWEHSRQAGERTTLNSYAFPEVQQRQANQASGSMPMVMCRACGETYSSVTAMHQHLLNAIPDDTASGTTVVLVQQS